MTPPVTLLSDPNSNLKLLFDHRGAFILLYAELAGVHPIRLSFPPHAKHLAFAAFERTRLFLSEIQPNPHHRVLLAVMTGCHILKHKPSGRKPTKARAKRQAC